MIELNPLEVLDIRKVDRIPLHFSRIRLSHLSEITSMERWIHSKCRGRYSISSMPEKDDNGKIKNFTFIGFEDEKEITYFMLACPHFRR